MPDIEVSANILTVNSYSNKTVFTALITFSLIRNNPERKRFHVFH